MRVVAQQRNKPHLEELGPNEQGGDMPQLTNSRILLSNPGKSLLEFSRRSPEVYAEMLRAQAGMSEFKDLKRVFLGDSGAEVEVRERRLGFGLEFTEVSPDPLRPAGTGWLVVEQLPSDGNRTFRARVFRTFEGAAAEFSTRLQLRENGEVSLRELSTTPGTMQLTYRGDGGAMVMAPMESASEATAFIR
jgi:hypothetical protein